VILGIPRYTRKGVAVGECQLTFYPQVTILSVTGTDKTLKLFNSDNIKLSIMKTSIIGVSVLNWNSTGSLLESTGEDKIMHVGKYL
jgi:WD40 repeat protein